MLSGMMAGHLDALINRAEFEADIFTFPDNMKLNSYYDIITTGV